MQIGIVLEPGSFKFYTNGNLIYIASSAVFSLRFKMEVNGVNNTTPGFSIKKASSMLSVSFDITRPDNSVVKFKVVNAMKRHFQCKIGNDTYDIYGHKIETCSVYKNDMQIAWWDLKYTPDRKIIANNDCERDLLISFYLITQKLILVRNDSQGIVENLVTNIFETKAFDPNWQPKTSAPPPL